ncbi:murein DD-endopeptidase MepM [Haemophilus influenzae]|uniref:Murein DD-endopeptidase MepM n=1 Tax=Haemophilus influenzae TaxID=727 RepID=A0AAX3ITW1_HAEIF|nr:murein DD-endopeptidase MepM [Haemophilus influenzae]AJO88495.1 Glycyl-glycine endopeptidase ALE-1 precursor [Haemophilus influenzae]MCK8852780.1 murein DD-endopeptidase MepM [Haemophilus influenzae]MCK9654914.1 murein DD-endopeptidase MepM [Haemophilus influenzae]PRI35144.1 Murein DD-endopeptidase MepM [Haemophilus influenzae]PRI39325.1 Murein DD-endopeptidase MepM [Haemophilus influenzae]
MPVQHVKLARDRRKKRAYIKVGVFFVAILLILTGILLTIKDKSEENPIFSTSDSGEYHELNTSPNKNSTALQPDEDATSYDDELQAKDDEVDEVKLSSDDLGTLPQHAQDALNGLLDAADQAIRITDQFSYTVTEGDTLKDVLVLSGLDDSSVQPLIKLDPELAHLKAGQQFYWILNKNDNLEYLNWLVSEKEERIYERLEDGKFKRQVIKKKSIWRKEVLKGEIQNSLNSSLREQGLDTRQISQLSNALQWQVSLRKLKKGTQFAILVSREYLGDKLTGQGNVEALRISSGGKNYYAVQAANGRYYNQQGETLGKGFARYPLQRQARVSSPFNPNRRHPVTGRVRPHKGVDFSVSQGTPVIAPADGTVEKVAYQAGGAGRYVMLRHGREYQTVYMHLSKSLVKAGQTVKKGERIALSGNTGISTGPHLHYEFHINGRAVNPLTVKLPGTSSGMSSAERKQFLVRVREAEKMLKP